MASSVGDAVPVLRSRTPLPENLESTFKMPEKKQDAVCHHDKIKQFDDPPIPWYPTPNVSPNYGDNGWITPSLISASDSKKIFAGRSHGAAQFSSVPMMISYTPQYYNKDSVASQPSSRPTATQPSPPLAQKFLGQNSEDVPGTAVIPCQIVCPFFKRKTLDSNTIWSCRSQCAETGFDSVHQMK